MKIGICLWCLLPTFYCTLSYATIWYVHPDSTLNTIQWALDSCEHYDTVLVASGTYHEHITWPVRSGIRLISEQGPDETIIDAENNYRTLFLVTGLDTLTTIDGFTITGGSTGEAGGGIFCNDNSQPLIQNNIIRNNTAMDGGGIFVLSSAIIRNNTIIFNGAVGGGGIFCAINSSPVICNNKLLYNLAAGFPGLGGGISLAPGGSPMILNNKIIGNQAYAGGGISCNGVDSTVFIVDNTLDSNSALWAGGGIFCGSPNITDNIFTHNTAEYGAGLAYWWVNSIPIILSNTFEGNLAVYGGGISDARWIGDYGLFELSESEINADRNSMPIIARTMFIANSGDTGAALCCIWNTHPQVEGCTFLNNYGDAIFSDSFSNPIIHNNDISGSGEFAIHNRTSSVIINAEYNWWGDSTGPYHPDSNPGGLGDSVSDYVDFTPWLYLPGVEDKSAVNPVVKRNTIGATIFTGPLLLPEDRICKVFDIMGRVVIPAKIKPGIYFIEVDGEIRQKVIKIR